MYELVGRAVIQSNGLSLLTILPFQSMIVHILPVFIGAGLFIGVVGSVLAIRKFLQVSAGKELMMGPKRRKKLMALMAGIMAALMILPMIANIFVR